MHHLRRGRTRWVATGAVIAFTLGSGGLMSASASVSSGDRSVFVPITPCRVMDTRPAPAAVGPRTSPLGEQDTHTISVRGTNGNCVIPSDAIGLSMNVTVDNPSSASYLTVFPADVTRPLASNLNWTANQAPVANAVTTNISADGKVSFFNNAGTVNVIADIVGYYVDHNHDDRYYTKAEINARGHFIAIDLFNSEIGPNVVSLAPGRPFGLGVITPRPLFLNFIAPFDLTDGTAMTLQVFYYVGAAGCTVSLQPGFYSVSRPGVATLAPSATSGMSSVGGDVRLAPSPAFVTGTASFTLDGPTGGGLHPGDIIDLRIDRGTDTCPGSVAALGAQVTYG